MNHMTRTRFLRGDWEEPAVQPSPEAVARIASTCLTYGGVYCRSCADECEPQAIVFRPRVGGTAIPEIERQRCTGCGECCVSCPVQAIALFKRDVDGESI